ncbi:hypothetical protein [Bacteroides sp. UBA939]|uniref:hypothetical protein n=1 Tax=Bacteroides sp. UBA939 TaxID=1946092 RepID=UPI0025C72C2E|nr:hypothetical protein [Bacteroides sp. UBA939]
MHSKKELLEEKGKKMSKLRKAAEPLIKLINEEYHPHVTVIVTSTKIELLEGVASIQNTNDFILD